MTDRYRCSLENQTKLKLIGKWPIDIGAVPKTQNELKLIGKWLIDMGAAPTQTQTYKKMNDRSI